MNYSEFRLKLQNKPVFFSRDILRDCKSPQVMRNQLLRWQKKGLILGLRKGVYVLNKNDCKKDVDQNMLATLLYGPSYISLEYALSFYGIIPEAVSDLTLITTRKTKVIKTKFGKFVYRHIQPFAFRGFKINGKGWGSFFIAEPEKSVVDFLYLNLSKFNQSPLDVLKESYRFQNVDQLNSKKLIQFGEIFRSKKLLQIIEKLSLWVKEEQNDRCD